MAWRNCRASVMLVNEVNLRWPSRDKASDGTIGDAAHATRNSDHNPWVKVGGQGVVRARDIDKDGIDAAWLVEHLRRLGAGGDPRLVNGGYIIFNRRITNSDFRSWRTYNGSNPHTSHVHVSFTRDATGFDSTNEWGIRSALTPSRTVPVEDDMTPEQDQMLRAVFQQLAGGGATPQKFTGWPTWGGGTGETLTMVDLARRSNVEVRVGRNENNANLAALRAEVSALSKQVGELAAAVRAGGGAASGVPGMAAVYTITGTATPKQGA